MRRNGVGSECRESGGASVRENVKALLTVIITTEAFLVGICFCDCPKSIDLGTQIKREQKRVDAKRQKCIDNCEIRTHALSDHETLVDIDPGNT